MKEDEYLNHLTLKLKENFTFKKIEISNNGNNEIVLSFSYFIFKEEVKSIVNSLSGSWEYMGHHVDVGIIRYIFFNENFEQEKRSYYLQQLIDN